MALPAGPRAPAAVQTALWVLRPNELMDACRRRFGDVFTLNLSGEPKVFVADPASGQRLLADDGHAPFGGQERGRRRIFGDRSIFVLAGEEHRSRRRMIMAAIHRGRMSAHEDAFERIAVREASSWPIGRSFALQPHAREIALQAHMQALFGERRTDGGADAIRRLTRHGRSITLQLTGAITKRMHLPGPHRALDQTLQDVDAFLFAEIAARRADPDPSFRGGALSALLAAEDEAGEQMDDAELRSQLLSLLSAGLEATATALAWCFELLLRHPAALERVRSEIEQGDEADDFLEAAVKEALRLRPVIPMVGRRLGAPIEIDGHTLPEGTDVLISTRLLHTHSGIYPHPYTFRPDRFLDAAPNQHEWLPFGGGSRRCPGAPLALLEIKTAVRAILRTVELRSASGRPERIRRHNVTLAPRRGARVVVVRRLG